VRRQLLFPVAIALLVLLLPACSSDSENSARPDELLVTGGVPLPGTDDRIVLLTKGGYAVALSLGDDPDPALVADFTEKIAPDLGQEEGLLSIAFSPGFEEDSLVYLNYTAGTTFVENFEDPPEDPRRNVISRFRFENEVINLDSEEVVIEIPQPHKNHNAGQLAFGPDGYLYIGVGDGGGEGDPSVYGQSIDELFGSILRIDVSPAGQYIIPDDNPFVAGPPYWAGEVWAYGFRNPWRFSFDDEGRLWAGDVGQSRFEEVNIVERSGNYGWKCYEGSGFYENGCDAPGHIRPVHEYGREDGCAIIGGYVYEGSEHTELAGKYLFGDYCLGTVWSMNTTGEPQPEVLFTAPARLSSFVALADGEILVATANEEILTLEGEPAFDDLNGLIDEALGDAG
jgi:glucose/arabinose dehydrogenase